MCTILWQQQLLFYGQRLHDLNFWLELSNRLHVQRASTCFQFVGKARPSSCLHQSSHSQGSRDSAQVSSTNQVWPWWLSTLLAVALEKSDDNPQLLFWLLQLFLQVNYIMFAWLISCTFLANKYYFSLTTNQPTVLSAMAYQQANRTIIRDVSFSRTRPFYVICRKQKPYLCICFSFWELVHVFFHINAREF